MKNVPLIESLGLALVFAGLVFVGMEIRQNNQLAQAAAFQEIGLRTAENWYDMAQDPDFNRIVLRHWRANPDCFITFHNTGVVTYRFARNDEIYPIQSRNRFSQRACG